MKDCFAMSNGGCGVLNSPKCLNKPCKFYKTTTQLRVERRRSYNRLMEMGRLDLIDKYTVQAE
jgi:hypothetical protein